TKDRAMSSSLERIDQSKHQDVQQTHDVHRDPLSTGLRLGSELATLIKFLGSDKIRVLLEFDRSWSWQARKNRTNPKAAESLGSLV
ncbi:MAG: hypothetical protein AAF637_21905, partial [Pseudomonadota bacterium]